MSGPASVSPKSVELRVGGLARLSTCDLPGELVATVFCQGCAWDCPYCHNPHLRPVQAEPQISWGKIMAFLESRRGLLDAVVFSGGEPTIQAALLNAVQSVHNLGFRVGLHSAGMVSERFAEVLPLLDWVGFDVKAPFSAYSRITGVNGSGDKALASLNLLMASNVQYEVRTTFHPGLLSFDEMLELRDELLTSGVKNYAVQLFRSAGTNSKRLPLLSAELRTDLPQGFGNGFDHFLIRGE